MDPKVAVTTAQIISTALSSLKSVRELAKDSSDRDLKESISDLYDLFLEIKERVIGLEDENRKLADELAKKSAIEGPIPPFGYFYESNDRENPICPTCYQAKERRIGYLSPLKPWNGGTRRECLLCGKAIYETEMNLSPTRNVRIVRS